MASSLTRSALSFRRQGSSGFVWRQGWTPGESNGYGRSAQASTNNVDAAADAVLSENMVKLPESSTNQVLLESVSLGSNRTPSAGTAYSREDHRTHRREITSTGAPEKTNSRFTRWVKRTFSKSSRARS